MNENYLGNPNLKRSNVNVQYTKEQIEEYIKCAKDPVYFIQEYIQIVNVDKGLVPFKLYDFQNEMVNAFQSSRFVINKLPRQSGKSTTVTAYMLWLILFHDQQSIAILANKGSLARDLLGKIQLAYEHLPKWLQQGIVVWNKGNIELENGSKIIASATSSSAIRGGSYNLIFLDEFAFVSNNIAENFFASVYPTISSGETTKVIIVSTPNGLNHFYKLWSDAIDKKNQYKPIEVTWNQIPGRDEKWKSETISNTSEDQFRQEFECEFIGSMNTLISPSKLRAMRFKYPVRKVGNLTIYEEPQKDRVYVMTVDTARGVGLDYSAFLVFDVTKFPYKVVATFRDKNISPMLYPTTIHNVGMSYNEAFILVETNDIGQQVVDILHNDLTYENLMVTVHKGRAGQQVSGGFGGQKRTIGVKTTKQVKRIGCSNLKDLIENDKIIIEDFDLISELSGFVGRGSSYEAEEGMHDDLVMCTVLFSWIVRQDYFKEITDTDIREKLYNEKMKLIEDQMLPFGFIDDGSKEDPGEPDLFTNESDRWVNIKTDKFI
jgi:hypothetical protein